MGVHPRGTRRGALLTRVLVAAAAAVVAVAAADVVLRAIDYRPTVLPLFEPRPDGVSYRLRSRLDIERVVDGQAVRITTNSQGMRQGEVDATGSRPRLALLGDSFTFGLWAADQDHTVAGVLQERLGEEQVEVLNFGVPGYGYTEMAIALTEDALPLDPEWVVLVTYNGNDFLDTWLGPVRFRVSANGSLEHDVRATAAKLPLHIQAEHPIPHSRFIDTSPLVMLARTAARWALPQHVPSLEVDDSWHSDVYWSRAEYTPFAVEARDASLAELARIEALCRAAGTQLVLVAMPYIQQVNEPGLFGRELDIDVPQRSLAAFARDRGVPFLDLRPGMAAADQRLYVEGEGHLTNAGHAVAGRLIGEFLEAEVFSASGSGDVAPREQHQGQAEQQD